MPIGLNTTSIKLATQDHWGKAVAVAAFAGLISYLNLGTSFETATVQHKDTLAADEKVNLKCLYLQTDNGTYCVKNLWTDGMDSNERTDFYNSLAVGSTFQFEIVGVGRFTTVRDFISPAYIRSATIINTPL